MSSGLTIEDISQGTGAVAARGHLVTLHFNGFLNQGDQFGSSYTDGQPIRFIIGKREVIAGLERGVIGMQVGGHRRLIVSPHLAYRGTGVAGRIPPDAALTFEIELLDVQAGYRVA